MACFHRHYDLGDENLGLSMEEVMEIEKSDNYLSLPLYLMDHSGLDMRTDSSTFRAVDSAGWDWGKVGIIFVSNDQIEEEYGSLSPVAMSKARKVLESEVELYASWLRGDVFYYVIENNVGEEISSCGGFYGTTDFEDSLLWKEAKKEIDFIWQHEPSLSPEVMEQ